MKKPKVDLHLSESQGIEHIFKEFLDSVESLASESEEEGWEKVEKEFLSNRLDMDEVYENVDKYGSDKTIVLFEIAKLKGVDEATLLDAVLKTSKLELTSPVSNESWDENFACKVPANTEFEIDLHDVSGTIDSVYFSDLYSELVNKLDPDEVKRIEEYYSDALIEDGIMYISIPQYYWSVYIDQPGLLDELAPTLRISPDELKEMEDLSEVGGV